MDMNKYRHDTVYVVADADRNIIDSLRTQDTYDEAVFYALENGVSEFQIIPMTFAFDDE